MVVHFLLSLENNSALTLDQKLALLLTLVDASRSSELQALDLGFRVCKPEGVLFRLSSLTKKRTTGTAPKEVFLQLIHMMPRIVTWSVSENLRTVQPSLEWQRRTLQIHPHKLITSQRIANWIKDLLSQAGVEVSIFKAHTVREFQLQGLLTRVLRLRISSKLLIRVLTPPFSSSLTHQVILPSTVRRCYNQQAWRTQRLCCWSPVKIHGELGNYQLNW